MAFKDALKRGLFVMTTEVAAPGDLPPEQVADRLRKVTGRVDGVSLVGDPAAPEEAEPRLEGVVGDTLDTCEVLKDRSLDPIYRTPARLKHRPDLQQDLLAASQRGVDNLLLFTEDYRISGDSLQEIMFFHVDAAKLFSVLGGLRDGRDIHGEDLDQPVEFCVGAGVEAGWGGRVPDVQMREIDELARGGTDYMLTTPVFDPDHFSKFVERVKPLGVPVIAEVMILRNATMARHLNRYVRPGMIPDPIIEELANAPDKQRASIALFARLMRALRGVCDGVHIVPIGAEEKLHHYLNAASWGGGR